MRSQSKTTLSIPADATYLQVGCRSSDIIDYLCPLRDLIRQGSYSLFILDFKLFIRTFNPKFLTLLIMPFSHHIFDLLLGYLFISR